MKRDGQRRQPQTCHVMQKSPRQSFHRAISFLNVGPLWHHKGDWRSPYSEAEQPSVGSSLCDYFATTSIFILQLCAIQHAKGPTRHHIWQKDIKRRREMLFFFFRMWGKLKVLKIVPYLTSVVSLLHHTFFLFPLLANWHGTLCWPSAVSAGTPGICPAAPWTRCSSRRSVCGPEPAVWPSSAPTAGAPTSWWSLWPAVGLFLGCKMWL